ncbi:DNA-directed RNA polymerase subunit beta [Candidatus Falkowbacteria bacterium]|jgi:DNA-directed RNA polymerase subunit beta|nr:DNA-directed RNA polymerase subunit beta [Candidatus Falkowbacteria bacterium]MBT4432801.1 DNA-directed RNA polymerase subunit beta [Candidatus Falkowbacteria bacterium]
MAKQKIKDRIFFAYQEDEKTNLPGKKRKYESTLKNKKDAIPLPDLVEVQQESYKWFLDQGIKEIFEEISPIKDFGGQKLELSFLKYYFDEPKFDELTSRKKNVTFESPMRVDIELKKDGKKLSQQEIYLGDIPLMTETGTFIINGIERAIVSQLIRSAGVFFSSENVKGKNYYGAKIIPNRGAWLEIETDINNVIWVKIDRKRKIAVTSLLRAFGYSTDEEIKELFQKVETHPDFNYIEATLKKDITTSEDEGLMEVYKRIRPGDLAGIDNVRSLINAMFFNFDRYDFGKVGRYKLNRRFNKDLPITKENRIFDPQNLVDIVEEIISLNISQKEADDIDHLGNRRIRTIGELVQNRFRIGVVRMERIIRDRMSTLDETNMTPARLINSRPLISAVKEFFMSSQLCQFMDQTNPLAELEHKRRLSAMGPGGLTRERAGFEVRDVHRTHYGKICPIATPEGPNIGLVGHLASYAHINEYGFLETPYRKVLHDIKNDPKITVDKIAREDIKSGAKVVLKKNEKITSAKAKELSKIKDLKTIAIKPIVTDEILFLDAFEEEKMIITTATSEIDKDGYFLEDKVEVRKYGVPDIDDVSKVDFMDVSPKQIVSIATSLIPFLEHDDAVRALMGTNMQRQAVPLVSPQAPFVGTGVEEKAALDSGHVVRTKESGKVSAVSADKIEILNSKGDLDVYDLSKFVRSNQSTCINQHPIVEIEENVKKGQALSDGQSIEGKELALGRNILVAFMSWEGYNYEDAIIISERLVKDDFYSSIHINNYSIDVRDTKLGPEIVTRDIPNIGEEKLKNLDDEGVVRIGAEVKSGDILVGKITPKGETELSSEEKLLRAIFGEKAKDVRDTSLVLEHGEHGKIVAIQIFSRADGDKLQPGVIKTIQISVANLRKIQVGDKMSGRHGNKGVVSKIVPVADMPCLEDGTPIDVILSPLGVISRMNLGQLLETHLGLAAQAGDYKVATPPLDGIPEHIIRAELKKYGYPEDGKLTLYDGRTGDRFDDKTVVGYKYMLKLNHMVEDKIHQRSIGPYSLITQQPLGGKAQFGGQRFGEMEVWALEGYGAAHILQEMLTIKSDDVPGRSKAYESIIKGEEIQKVNIPESFNVLVREFKGLGLDVELLKEGRDIKGSSKDKENK